MPETPIDLDEITKQGAATAQNFAQIAELSVKIWQAALDGQGDEASPNKALEEINQALWNSPEALIKASSEYWLGQQTLWLETMQRWTGPEAPAPDTRGGKRFAHKGWSENALFDYITQGLGGVAHGAARCDDALDLRHVDVRLGQPLRDGRGDLLPLLRDHAASRARDRLPQRLA